jgi:serine protease Do
MDSKIEYQQLIDRYLRGELSESEKKSFEEKQHSDKEFAEEVDKQSMLIEKLFRYENKKQLKKKLQKIHQESQPSYPFIINNKGNIFRRTLYTTAIAASIAFAVVIGTLYFSGWFDYNNQVASYYELKKDIENLSSNQQSIWQALFSSEKKVVKRYSGTGFQLNDQGYFVTNHHLVKNCDTVLISNSTDSFIQFKATVVYSNSKADIAIIKACCDSHFMFSMVPFSIQANEVDLGQEVFTLGYSKKDIVFGEGTINSLSGFKNDTIAYETSVPANPGNSGAPLLDEKGNLIGIISGKHSRKEGSTFAIKSIYLNNILNEIEADTNMTSISIPSSNSINWLSRKDQIKSLQPFIYKVEVYR